MFRCWTRSRGSSPPRGSCPLSRTRDSSSSSPTRGCSPPYHSSTRSSAPTTRQCRHTPTEPRTEPIARIAHCGRTRSQYCVSVDVACRTVMSLKLGTGSTHWNFGMASSASTLSISDGKGLPLYVTKRHGAVSADLTTVIKIMSCMRMCVH